MCLNGRVFAAAAIACMVTAGAADASVARQASASVAGRVVHAESRASVSRARITLTSPALAAPRVAISAQDGAFEFRNLPAGAYTLSAMRTGFVPYQHGERRGAPALPLSLADGQRIAGLDIALVPAGVIAGQILDEDGTPLGGATVDALAQRVETGQPALVSLARTVTDDNGGFRLTGLPAGQYYVSAFDPAFANVGDDTGTLRYTATYHPGVALIEDATRVTVTPGVEPVTRVVFRLRIVRPARVSGRLATADRRQLISGSVVMTPLRIGALASIQTPDAQIQPDGTFTFRNVPAGRYRIRGRGEVDPPGIPRFAAFIVVVEGRDIENLELTLRPGAILEGTIIAEALKVPKPPELSSLAVVTPGAVRGSAADALTANVSSDGSYRIRGLSAGRYYITVVGLEPPWVLKDVTYRSQDVTDGIQVESGQELNDVRITITDVATDISGVVRDDAGRPVAEALVVAIPGAPQFWTRASRRFGVVRSDASGRYRIRGLPPSEYRVVATLDADERDLERIDLLQTLSSAGIPLSLSSLEERAVDLTLTALSPVRRTPAR